MFLDGIGIAEYRSFGSEMQRIGTLEKINIFIGQNNSGKSNVLLFLKGRLKDYLFMRDSLTNESPTKGYQEVDRHIDSAGRVLKFSISYRTGGKKVSKKIEELCRKDEQTGQTIERLFNEPEMTYQTELSWFDYIE
ncbi:hypothetical protein C2W62_45165 [Candidatus Entotheonella serta]|nr:hypothetical protein C2W62_45165 [Candidatus Entotheonella serta]